MNEYQKMLHDIDAKKKELEDRIAALIQSEVSNFQTEVGLPVNYVSIEIFDVSEIGEAKQNEVTSVTVGLDFTV